MKQCPMCKQNSMEDWECLCKRCWNLAKKTYKRTIEGEADIVERLKGQAKQDLLSLLREICKNCPEGSAAIKVPETTCNACFWKEKEKLIRAFLE